MVKNTSLRNSSSTLSLRSRSDNQASAPPAVETPPTIQETYIVPKGSSAINDAYREMVRKAMIDSFDAQLKGLEETNLKKEASKTLWAQMRENKTKSEELEAKKRWTKLAEEARERIKADAQIENPAAHFHQYNAMLAHENWRRATAGTYGDESFDMLSRKAAAGMGEGIDEPRRRAKEPEEYTTPFCDFLTENPTVFHAVDYFKRKLEANGYKKVGTRHRP
jgi:hypothetical protein